VPAVLRVSGGAVTVELLAPEGGVSPGQACVFYDSTADEARVLGGGTVAATVSAAEAAGSEAADLGPASRAVA
jgi:tRNA-specific 2-thiouridylase